MEVGIEFSSTPTKAGYKKWIPVPGAISYVVPKEYNKDGKCTTYEAWFFVQSKSDFELRSDTITAKA